MEYFLNRTGIRINWTQEQINYIAAKYEKDYQPISALAKEFNCDPDPIKCVLRDANVKVRTRRERYPRISNYFHDIDSQDKAYWLGVLYADGSVDSKDRISLGMIDREHIEKFLLALGATRNKITVVRPTGFKNASDVYYATIYDSEMRTDLINHGCTPRKTKAITDIPEMPEEFIFDFIRGYFDGDGCISFDGNCNRYRISFVCGSEVFLKSIRCALGVEHLSISRTGSKGGSYCVSISSQSDLRRIITLMYEHSTENTRLNRKYNKCQDCLSWLLLKN